MLAVPALEGLVEQGRSCPRVLHTVQGGAVEVDELRRFLEEGVVRAAGAGGAASSGTCVTLTLGGQNVAAVRLGSGSFGEVHLGEWLVRPASTRTGARNTCLATQDSPTKRLTELPLSNP